VDDKTLSKVCLGITISGILILLLTYTPEFEKSTTSKLLLTSGAKGILFGKIDYVIKNYPVTMFILNDGNTATIYYPQQTALHVNDFVTVYAENNDTTFYSCKENNNCSTLFANKVVKE